MMKRVVYMLVPIFTDYFHGARFVMTLALKNENDINE